MKRLLTALMVAMAMGAFAASASAAPQSMASGGGQTHDSASFGFNAKDNESGSFNYVGNTQYAVTINGTAIPVGSKFIGHCFSYTHVNFVSTTEARLFARCRGFFFVNGGPPIRGVVYLQAHVIDNGEPGVNDRACIAWGTHSSPGRGDEGLFVRDCGRVQAGNIQVKPAS